MKNVVKQCMLFKQNNIKSIVNTILGGSVFLVSQWFGLVLQLFRGSEL